MKYTCPKNNCQSPKVIKYGFFHRRSDRRAIQVFKCKDCKSKFSAATGKPEFGQNKRNLNHILLKLFNSGVSRNRIAKDLKISPTTVDRKLAFFAGLGHHKNQFHVFYNKD